MKFSISYDRDPAGSVPIWVILLENARKLIIAGAWIWAVLKLVKLSEQG